VAAECGVSLRSAHTAVRLLKLRPCRIALVERLTDNDDDDNASDRCGPCYPETLLLVTRHSCRRLWRSSAWPRGWIMVCSYSKSIVSLFSKETIRSERYVNSILRRDSVVGIVTGYRLDGRVFGVRFPVGPRIFSKSSRPALGSTQPPIQLVPGALPPVLKRPGREADHSSWCRGQEMWIYTSTPPYVFIS
jgi:hypothetical protein